MRSAHYDPDHNFAFIDHIVGGTIPNQFIPAVEKGCKELLERGALAGYRMQDVAVEVYLRQGPSRGQLGSRVQDRRPHRLQERLPASPARASGADRRTWK